MDKSISKNSKILYLISCSNHKQKGGSADYDRSSNLINSLDNKTGQYLAELRRFVLAYIKSGSFSRAGRKLIDLPYNKGLAEGPDFGEDGKGRYLQAIKRYTGRLYREISGESWIKRKHHVIILSGLYGLLAPEEHIQLYSLHTKDNRTIFEIWKNDLTEILVKYVSIFSINTLINLTAENLYRKLIDWDIIKQYSSVFHALGDQNVGPSLLESIGSFLEAKGLSGDESELNNLFSFEGFFKTRYEKLFFLKKISDAKKKGLPEEEVSEQERKEDEFVPLQKIPLELKELSGLGKPNVVFSFKTLSQFNELPKRVKFKVPKTLVKYIRNPRDPGLGVEKLKINGETVIRCRIDQTYRIHFDPVDLKESRLIIRAIGPHKLEGIG